AGVAIAVRPVVPLHEHRVDRGADRRSGQGGHYGRDRTVDDPTVHGHDAVVFTGLVDRGILQALGRFLPGRRPAAALPLAPGLDRLAIAFQNGLGIRGVLIAGHQVHQPAFRAAVEVVYQQLHVLGAVPADADAHDQAMFGVQRDVVPAVPLLVIVGIVAVAVL